MKHVVGHVRDLCAADRHGRNSSLAPYFVLFCSHPDRASRCLWDHSLFDSGRDGLDYSRLGVSRYCLVCSILDPCLCLCPNLGRDPSLSCGRLGHGHRHSLGTPSHGRYHENRQYKYPRNVEGEATFVHWERNASGSRGRGRVDLCPCLCLCRPVDTNTGLVMRARGHSDAVHRLTRAMRSLSSRTRVWRGDSTWRWNSSVCAKVPFCLACFTYPFPRQSHNLNGSSRPCPARDACPN